MSDLSDSSMEWWDLLLKEAREWYEEYMKEIPEKERDGGGEAGKAKGLEEVKKPDQPGQRPEDYWTTSANGKYVIRVHKSHRKVRFFPDDAPGCPVPVERLRGRRRTIARTTKDGPLKMFMDDWRNAEKTENVFEDESRWAGRTIFQLEGPEEEEPQEEEKEEGDRHDPADPELTPRKDLGLRAGGVGRRTGGWRDGRRRPGRVRRG